jgi:outer membrane lipoprotein-sorting protein
MLARTRNTALAPALALVFSCALVALVGAAAPSWAASSPEAQKLLDRLAELVDKGPFSVDYSADMNMPVMGAPAEVKMGGSLTQTDRQHMNMTMNMTMRPEGSGDAGMTMSVKMIADGTTMWTELNNPLMGGQQVMKVDLAQLQKLSEADATGLSQLSGMDPVSQIRQLGELFDFEVVSRADGKAVLGAELTAEGLKELNIPADDADALTSFRMEIDEKTGFPTRLSIGGDEPMMTLRFTNFKSLDPAEIPAETFGYAPPDGAQVIDLGAMMGAMGDAAAEPE